MRKIILFVLSIHLIIQFTLMGGQIGPYANNAGSDNLHAKYYSLDASLAQGTAIEHITGASAIDIVASCDGLSNFEITRCDDDFKSLSIYQSKRLDHIVNYFHSGLAPPFVPSV